MKNKILYCTLNLLFTLTACQKKSDTPLDTYLVTSSTVANQSDLETTSVREGWKNVNTHYTYHFTGEIDHKYAFDLYLKIDENKVSGSYNYVKYETPIPIEGTINDTYLEFTEAAGHVFKGVFDFNNGRVSGYWTDAITGNSLPFTMANPKGKGYPQKEYKVYVIEKAPATDTYYVKYIQEKDQYDNVIQIPLDSQLWESENSDKFDLYLEDYNFDGYLDLCVFHHLPSKHTYFLYNVEGYDYIENPSYNTLYSVVFATDFRKKLLYEYTDHKEVQQSIYQYQAGKLLRIYHCSNKNTQGGNSLLKKYYHYVNGNQKLINERTFKQLYGQKVLQPLNDE
ncbi:MULTISPECIES: XAC2610-related protein [unclassified Myroides]|uniref:XAC2610-related protein n=1 Tax=unclassified Myroides TaxID=2642485 RepID=UPI003D2F58D6